MRASREKHLQKCHTNVAGKVQEKDHLVGVEIVTTPKIRYEEADVESTVYFPGKNGVVKESTLSDDLSDEWTIGEERPWWYFRL